MKRSKILVILFFLIILLPVLSLLPWIFMQRWQWPDILPAEWTMRGVESIFAKEKNWGTLIASSVWLSTVVSFLSVVIALMSSRAMLHYDFIGKRSLYPIFLLPFIIPSTVFGMGGQVMFLKLGLGRKFLGVVIVHLIYSLPYATKLLYDGTKHFGQSLEEQALVLGADRWQSFWRISLPSLAPVILSAMSMSFIISFSQYFLTLIIGGGKIRTFSVVMVPYLHGGERSIAAAYSVVFLGICLTVFAIFEILIAHLVKKRSLTK
ncbi:MAG: ABC transporter permease subunit [Peptostreptococcaceae bacterium]|nr:ABC transporter permease subunit [Peptostreptococcaceae bacterium]